MESIQADYKKFPAKKRKIIGNDHLWYTHDHLLLVESNGITERYKRFYFKDIQALNLVKTNARFRRITLCLIFIAVLGILATTSWHNGIESAAMALLFFCMLLSGSCLWLFFKGHCCDCWIYSSVQKERLTPVNTVKTAVKFLDFIGPEIERQQGRISSDVLETVKERVTAQPSLGQIRRTGKKPGIIPRIWHTIAFSMLLAVGGGEIISLYVRSPILTLVFSVLYLGTFVMFIVSAVKQAGSTLSSTLKISTFASMVLLVFTGFVGYATMMFGIFKNIERTQMTAYRSWEQVKLLSQINPFDHPILLGSEIFTISVCFFLGILGLYSIRKTGR